MTAVPSGLPESDNVARGTYKDLSQVTKFLQESTFVLCYTELLANSCNLWRRLMRGKIDGLCIMHRPIVHCVLPIGLEKSLNLEKLKSTKHGQQSKIQISLDTQLQIDAVSGPNVSYKLLELKPTMPGRFCLLYAVFLANVNSRSRSLFAVARPSVVCLSSVCLSVTFVRPTQAVQIIGNISTALGTLD